MPIRRYPRAPRYRLRQYKGFYGFGEEVRGTSSLETAIVDRALAQAPLPIAPAELPLSMQPTGLVTSPTQACNIGSPAVRPELTPSESVVLLPAPIVQQPVMQTALPRYEEAIVRPVVMAVAPEPAPALVDLSVAPLFAAQSAVPSTSILAVRDPSLPPAEPLDSSKPITDLAPTKYEVTETMVPNAPATSPYLATGTAPSAPSCLSPGLAQAAPSSSSKTLLLVGGALLLGYLLFGRK